MKRSGILAAICLVLVAVYAMGAAQGKAQHLTEGKAITDSLAATADVFDVIPIPDTMDSLTIIAMNDSLVLYTVAVSPNGGTDWFTVDTTSVVGLTAGAVFTIPAAYAGLHWRLTADNQTSTTCFARVFTQTFKP
jgi:hypothetical protein